MSQETTGIVLKTELKDTSEELWGWWEPPVSAPGTPNIFELFQ